MKYSFVLFLSLLCLSFDGGAVSLKEIVSLEKPSISVYGDLKYSADFSHFDYVNPNAPKTGMLRQFSYGSFNTFNPFVIEGIAPVGISLTHDTLMKQSEDEPFSLYGLIADKIAVAPDFSWVSFRINPNARFNDGTSITPMDVSFSFNMLKQYGLPVYRYYYKDVLSTESLGDNRVIFYLNTQAPNKELPLILGELPVLSHAFWSQQSFTKNTLKKPISGGPYQIDSFESGRYISYRLNPEYWARDLPVNKGYYNFNEIRYDYYRDSTVALEAFKAGLIDLRLENEAKRWAVFQNSPEVVDGRLQMHSFAHHLPSGMQGFVFNLRRDIFKDKRIRQALNLMFDFEWANTNLFYNLYRRTNSYFDNSVLKAPPLPDKKELALLAPFKNQLSHSVFNQTYQDNIPHSLSMHDKIKEALSLFKAAGWDISQGVLQNKNKQPFKFEILLDSASATAWERITLPYVGRLKKIGIDAQVRVVDVIQYKNRLDAFDYDMIVAVWGQSLSPGNEQRYFWGSEAAQTAGSFNYAGIANPVVDALIENIVQAPDRKTLETTVHALDRVLLWEYLVVPHWYSPVQRYVFWDKFGFPDTTPLKGTNILYWWFKDDLISPKTNNPV